MDKTPPYNRLLVACLLTLLFSFIFKEILLEKEASGDLKNNLPIDYITIEGYVVSKRINTIWIAAEPKSIGERIIGFFTSNYGSEVTIVSRHKDVDNSELFRGLKINQKVLVYGDHLKESNPGQISAYHVEVMKSD
ncbi:DUF3221 domain-containing protein [Ornithinibacillus caprae]|uniref:DUF3221 domain-containing protein n=1 Tax=Ornithinibacillus caprae TaxID=2678566 RepID=UPI0012D8EACF|nr:DUF3221 domain-containing protein [Ornithinibacillus caprae]